MTAELTSNEPASTMISSHVPGDLVTPRDDWWHMGNDAYVIVSCSTTDGDASDHTYLTLDGSLHQTSIMDVWARPMKLAAEKDDS